MQALRTEWQVVAEMASALHGKCIVPGMCRTAFVTQDLCETGPGSHVSPRSPSQRSGTITRNHDP